MKNDRQANIIKKILNFPFESYITSILFIGIFVIILLQIFSREFASFLHVMKIPISLNPPVWTEEAARWSWVWLVFIGLSGLEKANAHLKVELLATKIPPRVMQVINILLDILYLIIVVVIFRYSLIQVSRGRLSKPVTLPMSELWLYIPVTIAMVLVFIRVVIRIFYSIKNFLLEVSSKEM